MKEIVRAVISNACWLRRAILLAVLFSAVIGCEAGQPSPVAPKVAHTVSGSGLFLRDFDYATGSVTGVHILKSTGNATFDAITLRKFKHWNCKPRTYSHLKVPIKYTVTDAGS